MQTNRIEHAYHELTALNVKPTARAIRERVGVGSNTAILLTLRRLAQHNAGALPEGGTEPLVGNTIAQKE